MKFTLSWLKDHLETDADVQTISETLTAIGLEVEEVVDNAAKYASFIIAEIIEAAPHPDADRLQVCKVNNGTETLQIVCGAPNARAGIKVVLAPVGTVIPTNDLKIKASKIRGVPSNGMMCSAAELGLGDDHSGIIEASSDCEVGKPFAPYFGLNDPLFDIAITPNRGDCLGVYGVARDLAAAGLGTLKPLTIPSLEGNTPSPINIHSENTQDCPLFVGRYFKGVKNAESPAWMKRRLESIGLKPISALVDITNYITFTYGRPLHVYDAAKLNGDLTVKRSAGGEAFDALNDKSYTIPEGAVVIADETGAQALGGVVGGTASGCELDTTEVLLEVALFDPSKVSETGRALDIITDSRYRFERNVDPAFVYDGLELATQLILELCGGETSQTVQVGDVPAWQRSITFPIAKVQSLGGIDIAANDIVKILESLGFGVTQQGENLDIAVPSWRSDVEGAADIVEEIVRIYGYDNIPYTPLPQPKDSVSLRTPKQRSVNTARRALAVKGMTEVITWSFMHSEKAALFAPIKDELTLQNPISSELDVMRPSLLPNLIDAVGRNANRGLADNAFFECGSSYHGADPLTGQEVMISGIRTGKNAPKNLYKNDRVVDVFDAKADALNALEAAGAPVDNVQIATGAPHWYHPGRSGVIRLGKAVLAYFGELHPAILKKLDVDAVVVGFEVFINALPPAKKKKTTARPKLELSDYQSVQRDFAFLLDADKPADALLHAVKKADKKLITDVRLFDVYQGKGIEPDKKSVALSVTLQPTDKTLTDAEIEAVSSKVIASVEKDVGGILRG